MYHTFTASLPKRAIIRAAARVAESPAMWTNCREAGRFTQWSIVASSGPAAATCGADGSASAGLRRRQVQG